MMKCENLGSLSGQLVPSTHRAGGSNTIGKTAPCPGPIYHEAVIGEGKNSVVFRLLGHMAASSRLCTSIGATAGGCLHFACEYLDSWPAKTLSSLIFDNQSGTYFT
jgi:hypothetical protein